MAAELAVLTQHRKKGSVNVDDLEGGEAVKGEGPKPIYAIQPSILMHKDGRLQVLCRTRNARIATAWSNDNGDTWSKVTLLDTRKTTPNCRVFEKYAVRVGGGCNHRYNLSDGVLLKDNHIGAAGSITKAITMAKEYAPFVRKIEIEVETLEQVKEAVEAGADIIMLDNMTPEVMKQAVELIDGRAQTECSGNITKENIARIREIGVDFVSSGALTHSAPILDISMKNLHAV